MPLSFEAIEAGADQLGAHISEAHPRAALIGVAALSAGVILAAATRGRVLGLAATLSTQTAKAIPELELSGETALKAASEMPAGLEASLSSAALRPPTLAEETTARVARMSFSTGKKVLKAIGRDWVKPEAVTASDDVRRTVFNRFLSTLDQDRYVVHGSYPLESQNYIVRKALTDLDILSTDRTLLKATRAETDNAVLEDIRRMVSKPGDDGLKFEVPGFHPLPPHVQLLQPRLRVGAIIARSLDGQELMRIPFDIRLGARTILDPIPVALKGGAPIGADAQTVVRAMAPEENFASKFYSYTNRTFGFTRKPKDLSDMAAMIRHGMDDQKVAQALEAWTTRGYTLGPMRHPAEVLGKYLDRNMAGQTAEQLDANFGVVQNYYARLAPGIQTESLLPGTSTSRMAQLSRFLKKQYIVYPVG